MKRNAACKEVVIITGASSGLGRALAVRAAILEAKVVLIARNIERLTAVADEVKKLGGFPFLYTYDLVDVYGIPSLYQKICAEVNELPTLLFNNAGYNAVGFVQNTPLAVYEHNYKVNALAPIAFIQCVLPDMIKQSRGVIANIMSAAMYRSFPAMSSYYASKSALKAIHESLKAELSGLPVQTLYVDPGGFGSNYWKNLDKGKRLGGYSYPEHRNDKDPAEVAEAIFSAIKKGEEKVDLSGFKDKIGFHLNYWAPKLVDRLIVDRNQDLINSRPKG